MPRLKRTRPGSIAGYWLSRRPGSNAWCRTWFDPAARQTRRASLGTDDLAEAERRLAAWVAANTAPKQAAPSDIVLGVAFLRYYEHHARHLRGAEAQRISLAMILRHVPPGITAAEFTPAIQRDTMRRMESSGYAYNTCKRAMGAAKAALRWAWKEGHLDRPLPFMELPDGPGRERVLTVEEMGRLWSQDMPHHLRMFVALMLGTAARPEALLQLTTWQCDVERRVINLNPPGRVQTKKRRPVLPMPEWLVPWIASAPPGHLVQFRGKPVLKIAKAFRTVRAAAGFGADVTAYTLRHSVATELARRGVPPMEIAYLLGHRMPDLRTTGRYVHVSPEHLVAARDALDALAEEVGRAATRPTLLSAATKPRASCVLAPQPPATTPTAKPLNTGAGEGIRTLDPNLGKVILWGFGPLRRVADDR